MPLIRDTARCRGSYPFFQPISPRQPSFSLRNFISAKPLLRSYRRWYWITGSVVGPSLAVLVYFLKSKDSINVKIEAKDGPVVTVIGQGNHVTIGKH